MQSFWLLAIKHRPKQCSIVNFYSSKTEENNRFRNMKNIILTTNLFFDCVDELPLWGLVEVVDQPLVLLLDPLFHVNEIFGNVALVHQTLALGRVHLLGRRQELLVERIFVDLRRKYRLIKSTWGYLAKYLSIIGLHNFSSN